MNDLFLNSAYMGVVVSLLAYMLGVRLKKIFKVGILNPLLLSIVFTIVVLLVAGVRYQLKYFAPCS